MKVDVVEVGSCQRKLEFEVPADRVERELERAYHRLKGQVRLRGFRPGRTPRKVLEARFGPQVADDVAVAIMQESLNDALSRHGIEPVGRPRVERGEVAPGASFAFSVTVDVRPEVELRRYTDVEVPYRAPVVDDAVVDEQVLRQRQSQARLVEVDRAVEPGDMVLVELVARDGDDEVVREPGTMIRTEGDPYYPGVEGLVLGAGREEERSERVAFPPTARIEAVAGRELDVTVKVLSVQANEVPPLTDELAEELGYEGGVEGMRRTLRERLEQDTGELGTNQARADLLRVLIDENPFDVPAGMVDQKLELLMRELRQQEARGGRDPRTVRFSEERLADLRVRAEFAAKAELILDAVARREHLEVTDADVDRKIQDLADQAGQSVEAVRGLLQSEGILADLRERMLEEKTLDWLLERARLVEPPPADEAPEPTSTSAPAAASEPSGAAEPSLAAEVSSPAEPMAASEADLSILDRPVAELKAALERGEHDAHLPALLAAEEAGKARKGALQAIRSRMG